MYHESVKKKVIVAGSRDFNNIDLLISKLDILLQNIKSEIQIISGGAKGADTYGETYATLRGHSIKTFLPDWDNHGKSAGYRRNEAMAEHSDLCVVFWDGKSRGTQHIINTAKKSNIPLRIVRY